MSAEVVLPASASRQAWLAARRSGIGGSDVAAILGLSSFRTPLAVWLDKTAQDPPVEDEAERYEWGHRIEPVLREKFADAHPDLAVVDPPGLLRHPEYEWALATPDGLVGLDGIWEGKNVNHFASKGWDDDGVPDAYAIQVLWYLFVTGRSVAHVSALLDGCRYVERTIWRDDDLVATLLEKVETWWTRYVLGETMPPPTERDADILGRLWTDLDADPVELDAATAAAVDDLRSVKAQIKSLGEYHDRLAAQVKVALADHTDGIVDGRLVVTWRASKPRTTFDAKALLAADPDLHARYVRVGSPVRTLLVKEMD